MFALLLGSEDQLDFNPNRDWLPILCARLELPLGERIDRFHVERGVTGLLHADVGGKSLAGDYAFHSDDRALALFQGGRWIVGFDFLDNDGMRHPVLAGRIDRFILLSEGSIAEEKKGGDKDSELAGIEAVPAGVVENNGMERSMDANVVNECKLLGRFVEFRSGRSTVSQGNRPARRPLQENGEIMTQ